MIDAMLPAFVEACPLPVIPPGWHDYSYGAIDNGRLALLRIDRDVAATPPHQQSRAWSRARLRISCFDGETESDIVETSAAGWPMVERLSDRRWVVVASRCGRNEQNVRIFGSDGSPLGAFAVGDGVGSIACSSDGSLWVGYMDQAIFSDLGGHSPAGAGLAAFSDSGACIWRFAHEAYSIADCYSVAASGTAIWACTYAEFPILQIEGGKIRMWANDVAGAYAMAADAGHVILAGGYGADANRLVLLRLDHKRAVPVGELRIPTHDRRLTMRGRNGMMHAVADNCWLRVPIAKWLATLY